MEWRTRINKRIAGGLLLFCLYLLPLNVSANANISNTALTSLEQLEPLINNGPEVLAALSSIAKDEALEKQEKQRTGPKYFGSLTYGYSNEPIFETSSEKNSYNNISLTNGLNFPMLGSWQKEKIAKLEVEIATMESTHRSNILLLNNLVAVRKAYATLWIEQQKEEVAKRFLSTEAETLRILKDRQAQGLVLPTDRLEFLSVYQDVRRDLAASKLRQTRALGIINLATGRKWDVVGKLPAPSLPSVDGKKIDLNTHPDIEFQNNLVTQYAKMLKEKKRIDMEGNLAIGLTTTRDFPGATGNGAFITFSVSEPVKGIGAKDQAQRAAAHELDKAKKEEQFIRTKLDGQVEEALAMAAYAAAEVKAREAHLTVMAEAIREKMLRRAVLPGDTFEQLQHSKSQYYRTAIEMLDREELFLQSNIDVISYVYPRGLGSETTVRVLPVNENAAMRSKLLAPIWLNPRQIPNDFSTPLDFPKTQSLKVPVLATGGAIEKKITMPFLKTKAAVYVWDAQPFLRSGTRTAELNKIIEAGFSRVLISLNSKQISGLASSEGKAELNTLLVEAKRKGLRIDLMLGDPAWAEAAHRGELLLLVKQLNGYDFNGIHLDIEPDSLPGAANRRAELLAGLADTLKEVRKITTLPMSVSMHPRYLEEDLGQMARQKLLTQGLEEIVVMIYSDNPNATAQRMSAIMKAYPNVQFSLAQSVEKNIPLTESYADSTREEFINAMHVLEDKLSGSGLKGIYIQAWEDYKKGEMR